MELDPYILKHLNTYIEYHICDEDADAFRNFALARIEEDFDHFLNLGWACLYGQYLDKMSN